MRRNRLIIILTVTCMVISFYGLSYGLIPTHLNRTRNPLGCSACHSPHGRRGTPTLKAAKEDFCFTCHGMGGLSQKVRTSTDMRGVFTKISRHPVQETSIYHVQGEDLPERNPATPRHVACADCHNVHLLTRDKPWKGVTGYTAGRLRGRMAEREYEVCYKCHSDSENLPMTEKNKREEFNINNASYHPVEAPGRNRDVPSLIRSYTENSTIKCTDCHGNDDPLGPSGPHGSNYDYILKARYETREGPESPNAYELCYTCHDRRSILENESFKKHKEHIVFNHIPCSACHTPHGSPENPDLIRFDEDFVSGFATYVPGGPGRPLCMLECHVGGRTINHNQDFYFQRQWP